MRILGLFTVAALVVLGLVDPAFAADEAAAAGTWDSLAKALCISVAAFGGALAQAKIGAAALDSIGRNPGAAGEVQTPMIIGLVLIESLVIYALVIAFII